MQSATNGGWDNVRYAAADTATLSFFSSDDINNIATGFIKAFCPSAVVTGNSVTVSQSSCAFFSAFQFEFGNVKLNSDMTLSLTSFISSELTGLANFTIESTYTKTTDYDSCTDFFNSASAASPVVALVVALIAAVRLF